MVARVLDKDSVVRSRRSSETKTKGGVKWSVSIRVGNLHFGIQVSESTYLTNRAERSQFCDLRLPDKQSLEFGVWSVPN